MAYYFNVNMKIVTRAQYIYQLLVTLVAVGWVVKSSSDGTTYNATGNQLTSGGTGAGGFANLKAWFRIQSPPVGNQTREFTFQCGGGGSADFRVKYSPNPTGGTGFTGGSPSATQTPSASDEQIIFGGGTDASPTFGPATGDGGDYDFSAHIAAGQGPEGYSFVAWQMALSTGVPAGALALDVMQTGSTTPGDEDPAVVYFDRFGGNTFGNNIRSGQALAFVGSISGGLVTVIADTFASGFPEGMGTNPWSGLDDTRSIAWYKTSNPYGLKGYSTLFIYGAVPRAQGGSIFTTVNPGDRMMLNGTLVPWNNSFPSL